MNFFVTKLCLAQDFRLELELPEFPAAPSLQQNLWPFFVNGDAEFILLREKDRVRLRRELKPGFFEQRAKFRSLFICQRMRIRIQPPTLNAQRSTFNDLLN